MQDYLYSARVGGLIFLDEQQLQATGSGALCGRLVKSFGELEDRGMYVLGDVTKTVLQSLRQRSTHLGQRREDEFGCALERGLAEEDPEEVRRARAGGAPASLTCCILTLSMLVGGQTSNLPMAVSRRFTASYAHLPAPILQRYKLGPDLRELPDAAGKMLEVDAVAYVGSHKTHVKNAK